MVNLLQRRRSRCGCPSGPAPSSPSTTWSSAIGVDAARYALARYSLRLQHRPRPRPVGQGSQRQPGLLRAVRPRPDLPAILRNAPTSASRRRRRLRPVAARRTRRRASCSARSPSSRGWSPAPPSCASRTGSRATSRTPPATYHRFYDTCRVLPMGDEEPTDLHRARLLLVDATRTVLANGLGLLGVSAPERM